MRENMRLMPVNAMLSVKKAIARALAKKYGITDSENGLLHRRCGFVTDRVDTNALTSLIRKLSPLACNATELIRLGPGGDGGYLVPDDLSGIEACFSPGVAGCSGFEKACAKRGMRVFLADASVGGPAEVDEMFTFAARFVGAFSQDRVMSMEDWIDAAPLSSDESDLLLQMDIEGSEYDTLLGIPRRLLSRFRIMVVEFHWLEQMWSAPFFKVASAAFEKVLCTHRCVHIHPNNNCPVMNRGQLQIPRAAEFTFYRRDRICEAKPATRFPHPLDHDCVDREAIVLPKCWIGA